MRVRCQQSNKVYDLAAAPELGKGAGGRVYAVENGTLVVKVMARPEAAKLVVLMKLRRKLEPFGVVCPEELVEDEATGQVVGYVMRLAPGQTVEDGPAFDVTPRQRIRAAVALAKAVAAVHAGKTRVVLRDLKDANVIVDWAADPPAVAVIDFDSVCVFQVQVPNQMGMVAFPSTYHTPGFNPAEHIDTPDLIPAQTTDLFALAVVLFILVFGRSPYDVIGRAVGDLNAAVKEKKFPRYTACGQAPTYAVAAAPPAVDALFRAALLGSAADRPAAEKWVEELEKWQQADPAPAPAKPPPIHRVKRPWKLRLPGRRVILWTFLPVALLAAGAALGSGLWPRPAVTPPTDSRTHSPASQSHDPVGDVFGGNDNPSKW